MMFTHNNFTLLCNMYQALIRQFLILNNIKSVVCTDDKEHFFDRIVVAENGTIKVFSHGLESTFWDSLYFDFTSDYAVCLANMEKDLFMQERQGAHDKFTFTFFN